MPSAVTKLGSVTRVADLNSKVNRITEKKSVIRYSRELETIEELKQQNELLKKQGDRRKAWRVRLAGSCGTCRRQPRAQRRKEGKKKNAPGGVKYSLRTSFANKLQEWFDTTTHDERIVSAKRFLVGETTEVLKSIGVRDYPIYFGGSKIEKNLGKNTAMNIDVI